MGAEAVVHLEEALHLVDDAVEMPGLVSGGRLVRVAVHRVALPDHLVSGGLHLLDDGGQDVPNLAVAHARDQRQAARLVGRVEALDVFDGHLGGRGGSDLQPDRVRDQFGERDVRAVELASAVADPQEVSRQIVELGVIVGVVEPQHRAFVVEDECFVAREDLGGVQIGVGDATGVHEPQAAVDLPGQRLVACSGG